MKKLTKFLLIALLCPSCGGGTELGGDGGAKSAGGAKSTVEKKAASEAEDPAETITSAKPAANVSGAFLVECGPALVGAGGVAPSGHGWYGCGGFDASGAKSAARKLAKLRFTMTGGKVLEPVIVAASGKTRYSTVAALSTAELADVKSAEVELDGGAKQLGKIVAAEAAEAVEADASTAVIPEASTAVIPEATCTGPHEVKLNNGNCETMVLIRQYRRADGKSYLYAVDGEAPPAADHVDNGAFFYALRPRPECMPGACGLDATSSTIADDGTLAIFTWGINTVGVTGNVGYSAEYLHNVATSHYNAAIPMRMAFRGVPSEGGLKGAAKSLLQRFAPVGSNRPIALGGDGSVRGLGAEPMAINGSMYVNVESID